MNDRTRQIRQFLLQPHTRYVALIAAAVLLLAACAGLWIGGCNPLAPLPVTPTATATPTLFPTRTLTWTATPIPPTNVPFVTATYTPTSQPTPTETSSPAPTDIPPSFTPTATEPPSATPCATGAVGFDCSDMKGDTPTPTMTPTIPPLPETGANWWTVSHLKKLRGK